MKLLFLLVFVCYFEKIIAIPQLSLEISSNGVAALLSCHLNYLKEGTLGDVKQETIPLNEKPYTKIRESIKDCLVNIKNNCGSIDYLEAKLENCEITHNRWLFPQPYWWIWSKNNQGSNHFVTPRTSTRPSTSSFPPTPPNEENDIDKNSSDNAQNPKCLASSFVYPNIKTVFLLVNGNVNDNELKKLKELFKKIPISHILAAPDTKSLKTATQISKNLKTIRVKYDPGFAKLVENGYHLETCNNNKFDCNYYKDELPKNENDGIFAKRVSNALEKMLKECTSENGYKFSEEDKKTRENALKRNFKTAIKTLKLLRKKVAPEVSLGKIDKNITNYLVVVAEKETIGKIHQRITGQWADVLNGSVSKFVEFESEENVGTGNGEMYKKLRLVRSNDIKHL
uniref:Uncharacterized protein n=1 Tax=Meloidogyne floridensis TaxID=298350 RepID=A0A915NZJ5_9BILA